MASEIASWLRELDGVANVDIDERPGTPQLDLNLDYERLARRGLDAEDVGHTLTAAFFGIEASEHRDLLETTKLRVLFDPVARRSIDHPLETRVRARDGRLVKLRADPSDRLDERPVRPAGALASRSGLA